MLSLGGAFLLTLILAGSVAGFGREWNTDRRRYYLFWWLLGCAVVYALPNWWWRGLLAVMLLRIMLGSGQLERMKANDDIVSLAAIIALLVPIIHVDVLPAVLWGIVLVGLWTVIYALVSFFHFDKVKGYALTFAMTKWRHLRFYEYQSAIAAGCGNPVHLNALCAIAIAAAIGLEMIGQPIGYWLVPVLAVPLFISQFTPTDNPGHTTRPQQGWAHVLVLILAWLPLWLGPWGWLGLVGLTGTVMVVLWRNRQSDTGIDSGRMLTWLPMLKKWWETSWTDRFLGWGPKSFEVHYRDQAKTRAQETGQVILAHHSHNEFVNCIVENGLIGVTCLLSYLFTTLYALLHAGPMGLAVYSVGVVLCSVAFVSFPWSFYHELVFTLEAPPGSGVPNQARMYTLGSPALLAISVAIAVTAEALLR